MPRAQRSPAPHKHGVAVYGAVVRGDEVPVLGLPINLVTTLAVLYGCLGGLVSGPQTTDVKAIGGTRGVCGSVSSSTASLVSPCRLAESAGAC